MPSNLFFNVGELNRFRWDLVKDRWRKQIARSSLRNAIIIGGFDYAIQEFKVLTYNYSAEYGTGLVPLCW